MASGSLSVAPFRFGFRRLVMAGLRHAWRVTLSVGLGVATATAVIVGALLVGDSMRNSLRGLTVERLGQIHTAVIPGGFFPFQADRISGRPEDTVALIFFPSGSIEARGEGDSVGVGDAGGESVRRVGSIQILGCDEDFWDLDVAGVRPGRMPDDDGVVLNAAAAAELGVEVGDLVTLRLPVESAVPADSPLGRRDAQTEGLPRMEVLDIVPDRGLGRFAIAPSQATPLNVYVARETIADVLQRPGQANALLLREGVAEDDLRVDLDALGLRLERIRREFEPESGEPQTIYDYFSLSSERLLLPDPVVRAVLGGLPEGQATPLLTYLANAIEVVDESGEVLATVPYSTITATEPGGPLGLTFPSDQDAGGPTEDGAEANDRPVPLVLNDWTAERLGVNVGDRLRVAYFEPEVDAGREVERYFAAVVSEIVPITPPATPYRRRQPATFDRPPTIYNDPDLTPTVPGVTDQESISDWDLPFALERDITREDDQYWNEYRLTPKAFLPLADGRRLFGSRFGDTTSLRIAADAADDEESLRERIEAILRPLRSELGWGLIPLREQQLQASRGTTPFDALFLSLSLFVILAAVMLIGMLFRLGLVERVRQFGTLMAVGWTPRRVAGLTLAEGLSVAALGVLAGTLGGILYARGVLYALRTWWVGAVKVPFLEFHWTPGSIIVGILAGWLVSALAIAVTIRSLLKLDPQSLLSGRNESLPGKSGGVAAGGNGGGGRWLTVAAGVVGVVAVGVAALGATASGQEAAAGFVGAGMLLLIASLLWIHHRLRSPRPRQAITEAIPGDRFSLATLVRRSAARYPIRSTLSIGLMAAAAFLIVAMSAFRLQPSDRGTGGFDLMGTTSQPLYRDLGDRQVRGDLLGSDADAWGNATVAALRLRPGQDASCNNLYQASQPTVLGVPRLFARRFDGDSPRLPGFQWAAALPPDEGEPEGLETTQGYTGSTPWDHLARPATGTADDPIPMILDQNTAMWSLQMREGVGEVRAFEYESGKPTYFRVVGLLSHTILQGQLLIGESNFERLFPSINGYRFFLFDAADNDPDALRSVLERRLGDVGMDVRETRVVLASLMAVQNTYLRTFQSLGALGLLLGTVGLAVAQLRSVLERRRELAVMRAIGFTRGRLAALVLGETAALLAAGIGCGVLCAVLAVLPYAVINRVRPPILEPLGVVIAVIAFGMLAGMLAVRRVLTLPLLSSLRAD